MDFFCLGWAVLPRVQPHPLHILSTGRCHELSVSERFCIFLCLLARIASSSRILPALRGRLWWPTAHCILDFGCQVTAEQTPLFYFCYRGSCCCIRRNAPLFPRFTLRCYHDTRIACRGRNQSYKRTGSLCVYLSVARHDRAAALLPSDSANNHRLSAVTCSLALPHRYGARLLSEDGVS